MHPLEIGAYCVGSVVILVATLWPRVPADSRAHGGRLGSALNAAASTALFIMLVVRILVRWNELGQGALILTALAAGCLSASAAILTARSLRDSEDPRQP